MLARRERRPMRKLFQLLGLAILVALGSDRTLTGTAGTNGGGDQWQFRLRLVAPEPHIQGDPAHPELAPVLRIPTFGRVPSQQPGAGRAVAGGQVPLPVKVVRVAPPEGATVSLQLTKAPRRLLRGYRLGPAEAPGRGRPDDETGPTAAPE